MPKKGKDKDSKKNKHKASPDGQEGFGKLDDSPQQKPDDHEECSIQTTLSDTPTEQSDDYVYEEEEEEHEDGASASGTEKKKKKGLKKVWSKIKPGSRKSSKSSLKSPMSPAPQTVSTLSQQAVAQRRNTGSFSSYEDVPSPHGSGAGESVRMKEIKTGQSSKETPAMNLALPSLEPAMNNRLTSPSGSESQSSAATPLTPTNSHPLEDSQTSTPKAETPSTDHQLSPPDANIASEEVASPNDVVFTIGKESSTAIVDKMNDSESQVDMLRAELARRESESEQALQRLRQESIEQIQKVRSESEASRRSEIDRILIEAKDKHEQDIKERMAKKEEDKQNEIQKILTEAANKHKEEEKQRMVEYKKEMEVKLADIQKVNEKQREIAIANVSKQVTIIASKRAKECEELKAELEKKEKELEEKLAKSNKAHEQALAAREVELQEQFEVQLVEKEQQIQNLHETVVKLEADKRAGEEKNHREAEIPQDKEFVEQQADTVEPHNELADMKNENEKLKADLGEKVQLIAQLQRQQAAKVTEQLQQATKKSEEAHQRNIEAIKVELETNEKKIKELEKQLKSEEDEKRHQTEQVQKLEMQMKTSKRQHSTAMDELKKKYEEQLQAEVKKTADAADQEMQKEKSEKLHEVKTRKDLDEKVKELEDNAGAADAESEYLRGTIKRLELRIRELEQENRDLNEQYRQLKVVADFKRQDREPEGAGVESSVDPSEDTNLTDIEKVAHLEKLLEESQQESENLRKQLDQVAQQGEPLDKLRKNFLKLHTEKLELIEKLAARDEELQQLRESGASGGTHPDVSPSQSLASPLSPEDPKAEVLRLREEVKSKDKKIGNLEVQVGAFQAVASEKEKLHDHSKDQSRKFLELRKENEAMQKEINNLKEKLKTLETRHSAAEHEMQHVPADVQEEREIWKQEIEAAKSNSKTLKERNKQQKVQIAKLQATLHQSQSNDDHHQTELAERDVTIGQLRTELNLLRVETTGLKSSLADVGKQNVSLEHKLDAAKKERDNFQQELDSLFAKKLTQDDQLERFDKMSKSVATFKETVEKMKLAVETKTKEAAVEKESLQREIQELRSELDIQKQAATQYKEDFQKERKDREEAAGRHIEELAHWQVKYQELEDERKDAEQWKVRCQELEEEKKIAHEAFEETQRYFEEEIDKLKNENDEHQKQVTVLKAEYEKVLDKLEVTEGVKKILEQEIKETETKLENEKAQLQDQLEGVKAENVSLQHDIHDTQKQLEDAIADIATLKAQIVGLQHDKREAEKQLEDAIADTARLSDDIMAKTQQVKQYKKQNDSYKADRDKARYQLQQTTDELQQVRGQLHQTTKRMQECERQIHYYQTQLQQRDEDDTSKAAMQQARWESEKLNMESQLRQLRREYTDLQQRSRGPPGSQLREVQKKYDQLRDNYDKMFKYIDQLQAILSHNQIRFPAPPKLSDAKPPNTGTGRAAQPEVHARSILERGSADQQPIDPSTLPPAIDMPNQGIHGQPQYVQAGDPYNQPQHGQAYHPNVDPQYLAQSNVQGDRFVSGGLQKFQHQNPQTMRQRSGSAGRQDMSPRLHHGQVPGRLVAGHDVNKSFTTGHALGVVADYDEDPQSPIANKQQGQLINQQWNAPRSPSSAQYQQQYHDNAPQNQARNIQEGQQAYYDPQQQNFHGYQNVYVDPMKGLSLAHAQQARQFQSQGMQQGGGQMGQVGSNQGYGGQASPNMQQQHQMPPQQQGQGSNYPPASVHGHVNQGMQQQQPQAGWQTQAGGGQMYGGHSQQPQGAQGGNFVRPEQAQQGMSHGQYQPQPNQPAPTQPPSNPSGPQENALMHSINTQIHEAAEEVKNEGEKSLTADAPFDPNLVCQMCQLQFKIGEIQKYKRHVATCKGSSAS